MSHFYVVALLYDIDALNSAFRSVHAAFSNSTDTASFLHCFAMKSCPLPFIVHRAIQNGLGIETASLAELHQALRCGSSANHIVFDSPCKTEAELTEALRIGVHVNVNSLGELFKITRVIAHLVAEGIQPGTVGLRINPLVGVGKIEALSTSTSSSKFGIKYRRAEASDREVILNLFRDYPFLNSIMCHVGSQGMSIDAMVDGVSAIVELADAIDVYCGPRIHTIDIGGGLSVNYNDDVVTPTFAEYAKELRLAVPGLFSSQRRIITEFGKSLIAKTGTILAKVEDTWMDSCSASGGEGGKGEHATVICHTGADLLLRTAYCPSSFTHRVVALTAQGKLKKTEGLAPLATTINTTTVHGPLCFSGDVVAKDINLAPIEVNDYIAVLDTGANTISLFSRHCSRQAPAVFVFCRNREETDDDVTYKIVCIKTTETIEKTLSFWD